MVQQRQVMWENFLAFRKTLPALPDAWKEGSVSGLRARGGYEVSEAWENGTIKTATIKAQQNGTLRVRCKDTLTAKGLSLVSTHDGVNEYEVAVKAGQVVEIKH